VGRTAQFAVTMIARGGGVGVLLFRLLSGNVRPLSALWDLFLKKSKIRHLPEEALTLLSQARKTSENCAKDHGDFLGDVHAANLAAFATLKSPNSAIASTRETNWTENPPALIASHAGKAAVLFE